jgi:DNA gyrase subunit B
MISSEEVGSLITALGCGIGAQGYNPDKLRYHRIIIMADADVDGSHIRTLLLTFFYRQMPELIERGHVYIAQSPLYKVKKGKVEHYLKNELALEEWLAQVALEDAGLYTEGNEQPVLDKKDLAALIEKYRDIKMRLKFWERRYPEHCLHALVELLPLNTEQLYDQAAMTEFCNQWQQKIDTIIQHTSGFQYKVSCYTQIVDAESAEPLEKPLYLPRIHEWRYGLESVYLLTHAFFQSSDYQKIATLAHQLKDLIKPGSIIRQGNREKTIFSFHQMYSWLMSEAGRGYTIQRYKGLGEMTDAQLAPVLDPVTRRLSQVTIEDAIAADQLFTILMGDVVEPRREFIEQNALDVTNIDA